MTDPQFAKKLKDVLRARIGERIRPYVEGGDGEVHCTSRLGTDLRCNVKGARNINYTGMADNPGTSGCMPDGEFEIYPVLGSANGVIVVDGPMNQVRESTGVYGNYPWDSVNKPLKLIVEEGKYVEAIGEGGDADKFRWLIENIPNADTLGSSPSVLILFAVRAREWVFVDNPRTRGSVVKLCMRAV